MIDWVYHRPPESCHETEIRVAELLRKLQDSPHHWTIIWGYYYTDRQGVSREGDFLILGPAGGLLVLEVKTTLPRHYSGTGQWEGERGKDPIAQLNTEWQGVLHAIKEKGPCPFVEKRLCVPGVSSSPDAARVQGIDRSMLVTGNDLENWLPSWLRIFGKKVANAVTGEQKTAVFDAFGQGALPAEKRTFIDYTEGLFRRQFESRFKLLDQLCDNRQLIIRGGTGTGKTWHALEQAHRYATHGDGRRVLFLTYNKALTKQLKRVVAMRQISRGKIEVKGWEELFFQLAGKGLTLPGRDKLRKFFEIDLPKRVLENSRTPEQSRFWPKFDALVVDEAQDHDTEWLPETGAGNDETGGWWFIYQKLLHNGADSPASIFHDAAQRPTFRASERFQPETLARIWSQPAHVRLQPAVRYTRQIWQFLHNHPSDITRGMIEALGNGDHLPEGPEPEVSKVSESAETRTHIESIIRRWNADGLCKPTEVLILHAQSSIESSPLGDCSGLCCLPLRR
ncbi:MAG: NERD domain-containing protein [Verrucomicrobiota bacterium JB025]|nr:NERD domain-containing protein [Verrucomicrobiota bacterium JB025]